MATIADRIRWILKEREWSQRELSRRAGLSAMHINYSLKAFDTNPGASMGVETVAAIAKAAGVSELWLSSGVGVPEARPSIEEEPQASPEHEDTSWAGVAKFSNLVNWSALLAGARRKAPDVPEWVWAKIADASPMLTAAPTVAMLVDLAEFFSKHESPPASPRAAGKSRT